MINVEFLLSFFAASFLIAVAPGPSNAFLMAQTFANGRAAGLQSAFGFALGGVVHTLFAVVGLTAILKASETAYATVQYAGAAYLCYLGASMLKSTFKQPHCNSEEKPHITTKKKSNVMFQAMMTEVLNPKVALFVLAFLPQFVSPLSPAPGLEMLILGLLVPLTALPVDLAIAFGASAALGRLGQNPTAATIRRWLAGSVLVGLGLFVLVEDGR